MKRLGLLVLLMVLYVAGYAQEQQPQHYQVTASALYVRTKPSANGEILGKVKKNQVLNITEFSSDGQWAHVQLTETHGWVSTKHIKPYQTKADKKKALQNNEQNTMLTWVYRGGGLFALLIFFLLLKPSGDRNTRFDLYMYMIPSIVVLTVCSFFWIGVVRWLLPAVLCMVVLYPLFYIRLGRWPMRLLGIVAAIAIISLSFLIFEGQYHPFWIWAIIVLNWILLYIPISLCIGDICPHCRYYAGHHKYNTEYTGSDISTEHSSHDTYSHSETHGNVRTNYYTRHHTIVYNLNKHFTDYYECMRCGRTFKHFRTETKEIGRQTY